jgi:hypothetical protein
VQISKLADTDVSLGILLLSVRYAADEKGVKALTIVSIEPGSVVEQMVQPGDIILALSNLLTAAAVYHSRIARNCGVP